MILRVMASKKNKLTKPTSWNKHYTRWMSRLEWKKERQAAKKDIENREKK